MLSDLELMAALQRGDRTALLKLVRRHQVTLYNFLRALCRDSARASDLCLQAFEQVFSSSSRTPEMPFPLYLYRIAYECWVRQVQRRALALPEAPTSTHPDGVTHPNAPALVNSAAPAARKDGDALIECLSPELKVLLVLKEAGQLSYEEIAVVLEISPERVARRMRDAYRYLRAGSACRAALPEPRS